MSLFNLSAVLRLDSSEYEKGLNDAEGKANGFGQALGTAAKVGAAGFAAAGAAVAAVTKQAVDGYAQQQQLVGGVQKLYGNMGMSVEEYAASVGKSVDEVSADWQKLENAQQMVLVNARNAFETAGMSANEYMQTATSFSAALINSLGGDTEKAAQQTQVAMVAMSDNVNTFGSDFQSVQNAFQGFAKQNYTMLDNLKLGYGGTKSEMERLIKDANEYAESIGMAGDLSIDSFSDIVTAIDLVQQKQGIAGTTAREAASTVSGSLGMLKGAWDNLIAGLGDSDAVIGELVTDVIESAKTVAQNLIPVVGTALSALGNVLTEAAPAVIEAIPEVVGMILPAALEATTTLFGSISAAIPALIGAIISTTASMFGLAGDASVSEILSVVSGRLGELMSKGIEIVGSIANGILQNAPALIVSIGSGLSQAVASFMQWFPQFLQGGIQLLANMANGIMQNVPAILNAIIQALVQLIATIASNLPQFLQKGLEIIGQVATGIINAIPQAVAAIPQVISGIVNAFTSFDWLSIGANIISGIASGITNAAGSVINAITGVASGALNGAKRLLGIGSPSKVFRKVVGQMIPAGMALGVEDNAPLVTAAVEDMNEDAIGAIDDFGYDTDTVVKKVGTDEDKSASNAVVNAIQSLADAIIYLDEGLQEKMEDALETMRFELDGREFGRLVRDVRTA